MQALLDFTALDGLAFAAERRRLPELGQAYRAADLGPVAELAHVASSVGLPPPAQASWLQLDGLAVLYRAMASGQRLWICPDGRKIGYLRTAQSEPASTTVWTAFGLAAQQSAKAAGFASKVAAQLAAAMGELYSNIYEHSAEPSSGLIAFRGAFGRFEFIVADRGIGVLDSLRSSPDYSGLRDHGEALRLTLTDGVSRFGPNSGRGHGFRPLFVGLANLNGILRFRSGDHALTIDGSHPTLLTAHPAQKTSLRGLFISVACEVPRQRPK